MGSFPGESASMAVEKGSASRRAGLRWSTFVLSIRATICIAAMAVHAISSRGNGFAGVFSAAPFLGGAARKIP